MKAKLILYIIVFLYALSTLLMNGLVGFIVNSLIIILLIQAMIEDEIK